MTDKLRQAAQTALEALECAYGLFNEVKLDDWNKGIESITALREALDHSADTGNMVECRHCGWLCTPNTEQSKRWYPLEQAEKEHKCKDHPDAPHGFCRDESITQDRYVCECEFWEPPKAEQEPVGYVSDFAMTNIEAMKLALDALEGLKTYVSIMQDGPDDSDVGHAQHIASKAWGKFPEAIAALRQQISEAEQAEFKMVCPRCKVDRVTTLCPNRGKPGDCPMTATAQSEAEQAEQEPVKCIVKNCQNHSDQGKFIGGLCSPCHDYLATGEGKYSQAYRNAQRSVLVVVDVKATADYLDAVISMAMKPPQRE